MTKKVVVIYSGGLDSTTLLYHLRADGWETLALSVDYGQRHMARELSASAQIAATLGIDRHIANLQGLAALFGVNSLTDSSVAVPAGAYSPETMAMTIVPNRNMILISLAIAWAVSTKCQAVAFGAHGGQYTPYPDCQPSFAEAMDRAAHVCDNEPLQVLSPFITWDKAAIVRRGAELGVPFEHTWSCYRGGEIHCGDCGTCLDRKAAFSQAGITDPTSYLI